MFESNFDHPSMPVERGFDFFLLFFSVAMVTQVWLESQEVHRNSCFPKHLLEFSKAKRCAAKRWTGRGSGINSSSVCAVLSLPLRREPLGASSDPAGSESLPALLHHCITKAKGVAANNNNNTTSARRTGWCLAREGWPIHTRNV